MPRASNLGYAITDGEMDKIAGDSTILSCGPDSCPGKGMGPGTLLSSYGPSEEEKTEKMSGWKDRKADTVCNQGSARD